MSVHYVSFSAEINPTTTEQLIALIAHLCNQKAKEIHLMLSTQGGSVMHGFNIYNILRAAPAKIITHNVGNVDSIGTVIFLAGENRYACPHSTFMFHGVGLDISQPRSLDENWMRERLSGLTADNKRIGTVIGERTTLNKKQVADLFKEAGTKDATWAAGVGFIDSVREPEIPKGIPIHSLVFKR